MPVRRMRPEEVENITPVIGDQTQGVTMGERTLAALASSPEAYREFLVKQGYKVRPYGGGWNFAVRKREGDPWLPVNPKGADAGDILSFLSDALTTVGVGVLSGVGATLGATAGAPGGPPGMVAGAMAGGAAGGAVGEAARQGLGAMAGIPENADPSQVAMSGLIGAAFPAGGAAVSGTGRLVTQATRGPVGKEVGEFLGDVGAIIAGIGPLGQEMSGGQVLTKFAAQPPGTKTNVKAVATRLHNVVARVWNKGDAQIAELMEARDLAKKATTQGVGVDLRAPIEALDRFTPKPGPEVARTTTRRILTETEAKAEGELTKRGVRTDFTKEPIESTPFHTRVTTEEAALRGGRRDVATTRTVTEAEDILEKEAAELAISEPELPKAVQGVVGRIRNLIGSQPLERVDPVTATKIIRQLQKIAAAKGAYENAPVGKGFTRLIATAGHDMRLVTERALEAAGFPEYGHLMGIGAERYGYLKTMYEIAGASKDDALRYVKGVYGENFSINSLHDFERSVGARTARISKSLEQAHVRGSALGPGRTTPRSFPRLTAVGTPLMLGASGLGWMLGGPLGVLASVALSTPRSVVAITRLIQKAGGPAAINASPSASAHFVKEAVKVLSISAAQGTGRRVISEDSRGRRRSVFMGE